MWCRGTPLWYKIDGPIEQSRPAVYYIIHWRVWCPWPEAFIVNVDVLTTVIVDNLLDWLGDFVFLGKLHSLLLELL